MSLYSPPRLLPPCFPLCFSFPFSNHRAFVRWPPSRNNLLLVCLSGCCFSAPFLKTAFSVLHPCLSFAAPLEQDCRSSAPVRWTTPRGALSLPSPCCPRFEIRVDLELTLGWPWAGLGLPWAGVGLTVYLPAGKQGHRSLCCSRPDFWRHSSKGFLGCYPSFFRGLICLSPGY